MAIEQVEIVLPGDIKELKSIQGALKEFSNNLLQIESFKELNNDIVNALFDKHKVPKKAIRKLAMMYHKQERDKVVAEVNQLDLAYDDIFNID